MNELDQQKRKHPGVAFAGFVVPFVLLLSVVLAYKARYVAGIGWRGGEYAYAFIGVAIGAILVGCMVKLLQSKSPWNSVGSGMVIAGTLGVVITIAIIALFMIAFSQSN
jgi:hypothetical protein